MNISVSTSVFLDSDKDLNYTLNYLEKKVKFVELVCDGNLDITKKENIQITQNYNLKYTIHCPLSDINLSSHREIVRKFSLKFVEELLKVANKVNSNLIVLHPGHNIFKYNNKESLNSLINSLKQLNILQNEYGVNLTIENMPSYSMFMFKEPVSEIMDNLEDLGITFDIGHSFLNNNIDQFLNYSDKIKNIHIHDNNGEFDDHLCLGKGIIDFNKYKNKLKKINCNHTIELQYNSINDIDKCITNLKKIYGDDIN